MVRRWMASCQRIVSSSFSLDTAQANSNTGATHVPEQRGGRGAYGASSIYSKPVDTMALLTI